jgi:hypothetical protein
MCRVQFAQFLLDILGGPSTWLIDVAYLRTLKMIWESTYELCNHFNMASYNLLVSYYLVDMPL